MTDQNGHDKYNVTSEGDKYKLTITKYFDTQEEAIAFADTQDLNRDQDLEEVKQNAEDNTLNQIAQNDEEAGETPRLQESEASEPKDQPAEPVDKDNKQQGSK